MKTKPGLCNQEHKEYFKGYLLNSLKIIEYNNRI